MDSLVMGSSWNFPAQASSSYEGSEPSQAELGHFNFRAETELDFFLISFNSKVFGTVLLEETLRYEFLKQGFLKSNIPFFHKT